MPRKPLPLNFMEFMNVKFNTPTIEAIAKRLSTDIYMDKLTEVQWLMQAIRCCDVTTLSGDDSRSNVGRLCSKARHPLSQRTIGLMETTFGQTTIDGDSLTTAAVCVYPNQVAEVRRCLGNESGIQIASVATGFPSGQYPMETKIREVQLCIDSGADEIDMVISRNLVFQGKWQEVHAEVAAVCKAAGSHKVKVILETGQLGSYERVYRAALVSMLAGADTVKTSTGKEATLNATPAVSLVMLLAVRDFWRASGGVRVGFKPAGGVRTADEALALMRLVANVLGQSTVSSDILQPMEAVLEPSLFRIGCSSLLATLEKRLLQLTTGCNYVDEFDLDLA